ncbi:hypothetical protein ACXPWS_22210 [Mycobacterium sp. BMJ-28]
MIQRARLIARFTAALLMVGTAALLSTRAADAEPTDTATTTAEAASRFPDLSGYTPVNPDDYAQQLTSPGRPDDRTGYFFTTPGDVHCSLDPFPLAVCTGNDLPGVQPAQCDPDRHRFPVNTISTDRGLSKTAGRSCNDTAASDDSSPNKVLPPFHTLTVYGVTCGVDDLGTTACKDPQGRGFVLSPSWSGWLAKIR